MRLSHAILTGHLWAYVVCAGPSNPQLIWKRQSQSSVPFDNSTVSSTQTPSSSGDPSTLSSFPSTVSPSDSSSPSSTTIPPGRNQPLSNSTDPQKDSGVNGTTIPLNQTVVASNITCSCTVNAFAGLDWWYPSNIFQAIASISTIALNGTNAYSLVPLQTSIDVDDQLLSAGVLYTLTETFDDTQNSSVFAYVATTPPLPQAFSTATITISDVAPGPTSTFGLDQYGTLFTDPPTPTFAVPGATGNDYVATQTAPLLYYTAYEVIGYTGDSSNVQNGSCPPAQTVNQPLSDSLIYPFPTDPAEDGSFPLSDLVTEATPTGSLDVAFLSALPSELQNCVPGSWSAPRPTMIVVVEVTYERGFDTFLVHVEVTDSGTLDGPGPTIEGGSPPASPTGGSGTGAGTGSGSGSGSGNGNGNGGGGGGGGGGAGGINFSGIVSAVISANGGGAGGETPTTPLSPLVSNIVFGIGGTAEGGSGSGDSGSVNGVGFGEVTAPSGPATTPPPVVIGGQTFTANSDGAIDVVGQTLAPGGSEIFVNGQTISLSPFTSLIVNGITLTPPPAVATPAAGPILSVLGTTFQAANGGAEFIIAGSTLTPGGTIVVGGSTISLAPTPTAIFINGVSQSVGIITQAPAITVDGTVINAVPGGAFIIGTQTLRPGQSIVASGTTFSLGVTGGFIVINGATSLLAATGLPYLVLGGVTYPATSLPTGAYIIAGNELLPGGVITVSGSTISLAPGGTAIIVNGVTEYLPGYAPITIGSETIQGHAGTYIIDGITLLPGGAPITVDGTTISLLPGGTAVVINGQTSMLGGMSTPVAASAVTTSSGAKSTSSSGTHSSSSPAATSKKGDASGLAPSTLISVTALLVMVLLSG